MLAGWLPEWAVEDVREMSEHPRPLVVVLMLGGIGGWWLAGRMAYGPQIEDARSTIAQRDDQLSRYRIALGIDKAGEGALVELTNGEMKAKAATTAGKVREMAASYRRRAEAVGKEKLNEAVALERQRALMREVGDEFQRTLRADAVNVDNELRRRLGQKVLNSIVGLPPTFYSDGSPIGLFGLISSANMGMDAPVSRSSS